MHNSIRDPNLGVKFKGNFKTKIVQITKQQHISFFIVYTFEHCAINDGYSCQKLSVYPRLWTDKTALIFAY